MKEKHKTVYCLGETHFLSTDTYIIESEGMGFILIVSGILEKSGLAILIGDKIDFRSKEVKIDTEAHYIVRDQFNNRKQF